jgi:hypothetical protein
MTEFDYQAIVALSIATWRIIATIRTPVLQPIQKRFTAHFEYHEQLYSAFVWTIAFAIGFAAAVSAGEQGDLLAKLGWWEGHVQSFGWAFTAGVIASGSAGLRWLEKVADVKTGTPPNA